MINTQPPPPPPPPPPSLLAHSISPNRNSNSNSNMPSRQFNGFNQPSSFGVPNPNIQPTTAGLMQYPGASEDRRLAQQVLASNIQTFSEPLPATLSSQEFKDELKAKQLRFTDASAAMPIEDRIKLKRDNNKIASNYQPVDEMNNGHSVPEKLLTTLQRDKRPFAYSPDVNDPNNRGKIDLSQIKSPSMRLRLQANMVSGESIEEDSQQIDDQERKIDSRNDSGIEQSATIYGSEAGNYRQSNRDSTPINGTTQAPHYEANARSRPLIQYNDPPLFYTTLSSNQSTSQRVSSPNQSGQMYGQNRSSTPRDCLDDLSNEITKSLDSLSQFVADFNQSKPVARMRPAANQCGDDRHNQAQSQRMSTFVSANTEPANNYCQSRGFQRRLNSASPSAGPAQNERSVGDYLLSPDTNYFSAASNHLGPYSTSPYYGSSLNVESRLDSQPSAHQIRCQQAQLRQRQFPSETYSQPNRSTCNPYQANERPGMSTFERPNRAASHDHNNQREFNQNLTIMRDHCQRLESELDNLQDVSRWMR